MQRWLPISYNEHTVQLACRTGGNVRRPPYRTEPCRGLNCTVRGAISASHRPFLNKHDRKRRLQLAKDHIDWMKKWASILFSDEMSIKLFMDRDAKDYVWRKIDEEFHPK